MAASAAIEFDGLTKDFPIGLGRKRVRALDRLTLTVPQGRIFGLLGPNGCGKSTALKVLMGLVRPTAGACRVFGEPVATRARRRVGYLPELPALPEPCTGRGAVTFHARIGGVASSRVSARVADVLERVGLGTVADRPVRGYSKGLRQRLGIAQALVHEPDLLVLDEPTSGLDPAATAHLLDLLKSLNRSGISILLTSHLSDEIAELCDAVALMDGGRVLVAGPVNSLLAEGGCHQLIVGALPEADQTDLDRWLKDRGGVLHAVAPARKSLVRLYQEHLGRAASERP